jgi:starvation-inducible DNA-binding protein
VAFENKHAKVLGWEGSAAAMRTIKAAASARRAKVQSAWNSARSSAIGVSAPLTGEDQMATATAVSEIPTDLNHHGVDEITSELRQLLADTFALYVKTKNFHWHMRGQHFRDYHLLLDEHSDQIFAMTDDIAERARKIGGTTLRSIGDIARHQRLKDNDEENVSPKDMLSELCADNQALTRYFRSTHETCDKYNDVATASMIEVWIDQTERRTWFLAEIVEGL